MKKILAGFIALALTVSLAACNSSDAVSNINPGVQNNNSAVIQSKNPVVDQNIGSGAVGNAEKTGGNILIAYFSMPEDVDISGADAVAGASVVVKDGQKMGIIVK